MRAGARTGVTTGMVDRGGEWDVLSAMTAPVSRRWLLPVYVGAIFTSAALLFVVQPMFSKLVLPLLGGSPQVWTTCLLWFQTALLLGYLYAHLAPRLLGVRRHAALHVALCLLALVLLPFGVDGAAPPASGDPVWWLLGTLTLSLGAPFVLLSSTGPLLQRWFSETDHPDAANPYFLYAASNAGSFIALLGYPLLLEPRLPLAGQRAGWAWGYAALVALLAASAVALRGRGSRAAEALPASDDEPAAPPAWPTRLRWLALAAVPSSLMMAVTTFLTTDLAPVPLLWVVPLALYLLTFVLVFARRQLVPAALVFRWEALALVSIATLLLVPQVPVTAYLLLLHLVTFFLVALACHGELARTRPPARHLTEFYLIMSAGGALGGLFNAVLAPLLFDTLLEYPIALVAACLVRPAAPGVGRPGRTGLELALAAALVLVATVLFVSQAPAVPPELRFRTPLEVKVGAIVVLALLCLRLQGARREFAAAIALLLAAGEVEQRLNRPSLLRERNFFGPREVRNDLSGYYRMLLHGTTQHGLQSLQPDRRREALSYYHSTGALGDVFRTLRASLEPRRVAIVGLGTGAIATYARPGERWEFYEIDADMVRMARDSTYFTYLADARGRMDVVLGDGRLRLGEVPDGTYHLIVLDAFSSDAIPVHLMTREALAMYLRKTAPGGLVAFHVSNRYLRLEPVLGRLARDLGVQARVRHRGPTDAERKRGIYDATWVVVGRSKADVAALERVPGWVAVAVDGEVEGWSDDFSNLVKVLRFR